MAIASPLSSTLVIRRIIAREELAITALIDRTSLQAGRIWRGIQEIFSTAELDRIADLSPHTQAVYIRSALTEFGRTAIEAERSLVDGAALQSYQQGEFFNSPRRLHRAIGLLTRERGRTAILREALTPELRARYPRALVDSTADILQTLRTAGGDLPSAAQSLLRRHNDLNTHRATRIIRTEAARAHAVGGRDAIRTTAELDDTIPALIQKIWYTALDSRVRQSHASMQGQQVLGLETTFVSGLGNHTTEPTLFGVAEEDINCRCHVVYLYTA